MSAVVLVANVLLLCASVPLGALFAVLLLLGKMGLASSPIMAFVVLLNAVSILACFPSARGPPRFPTRLPLSQTLLFAGAGLLTVVCAAMVVQVVVVLSESAAGGGGVLSVVTANWEMFAAVMGAHVTSSDSLAQQQTAVAEVFRTVLPAVFVALVVAGVVYGSTAALAAWHIRSVRLAVVCVGLLARGMLVVDIAVMVIGA